MIIRMGVIRKKDGLDVEAFRKHWREVHGPIAAAIPGLRRYQQNHVVDSGQRGIDYKRGNDEIDGFSQLWFDDLDSMQAALSSEVCRSLAKDEANFIGNLKLLMLEPNPIIVPPSDRPLIKRMSTLKRRADVSPEKFRHEWYEVHSMLVKRLPQVMGYTQNLVVGRNLEKSGKSGALDAAYEELPIDGIVELWFNDTKSIEEAFRSDAGRTLMTHATEFIDEISTFLVEPHRVV